MTGRNNTLRDPQSRGHMNAGLQRKVAIWSAVAVVVLAIVVIPLVVNPELRFNTAERIGLIASSDGEEITGEESDASLLVLPYEQALASTGRMELRFLAAFIAWPLDGEILLESLNGDEELTVPLESIDLVSASPDASVMYMQGPEQAVLVDVEAVELIEMLDAGESPDVSWDWQTAIWQQPTSTCDRVSNLGEWIGCFPRDSQLTDLASDWKLELREYGDSDELHVVTHGLGFRPIVGFTARDEWLYVANERGIHRYSVAEVTGSD